MSSSSSRNAAVVYFRQRLFIGNIPKDLDPNFVKDRLMAGAAGIERVTIYSDPNDRNKNRGFAFIDFPDTETAETARIAFQNFPQLAGRTVTVDWAEKEAEVDDKIMKEVKILYVRNVPSGTSEDELRTWMECGKGSKAVTRVRILNDYAFVHFETRTAAQIAMDKRDGTTFHGSEIEINWARPPPLSPQMKRPQQSQSLYGPAPNIAAAAHFNPNLLTINTQLANMPKMLPPTFAPPVPLLQQFNPFMPPSAPLLSIDAMLPFLDSHASIYSPMTPVLFGTESAVVRLHCTMVNKGLRMPLTVSTCPTVSTHPLLHGAPRLFISFSGLEPVVSPPFATPQQSICWASSALLTTIQ